MQLVGHCKNRLLGKIGQGSNQQSTVYVNMYRNLENCFNESEFFSLNSEVLTLTVNCPPIFHIIAFRNPTWKCQRLNEVWTPAPSEVCSQLKTFLKCFHLANIGNTHCAVSVTARKHGETKSIALLMPSHNENQSLPPYITVPVWLKTTRHWSKAGTVCNKWKVRKSHWRDH